MVRTGVCDKWAIKATATSASDNNKRRRELVTHRDSPSHPHQNAPQHVRAASQHLLAPQALPDARRLPLDAVLAAEGAVVLGVLRHLHLLDDFPERRAVTRAVLAANANLLRVDAPGSGCEEKRGREEVRWRVRATGRKKWDKAELDRR